MYVHKAISSPICAAAQRKPQKKKQQNFNQARNGRKASPPSRRGFFHFFPFHLCLTTNKNIELNVSQMEKGNTPRIQVFDSLKKKPRKPFFGPLIWRAHDPQKIWFHAKYLSGSCVVNVLTWLLQMGQEVPNQSNLFGLWSCLWNLFQIDFWFQRCWQVRIQDFGLGSPDPDFFLYPKIQVFVHVYFLDGEGPARIVLHPWLVVPAKLGVILWWIFITKTHNVLENFIDSFLRLGKIHRNKGHKQ